MDSQTEKVDENKETKKTWTGKDGEFVDGGEEQSLARTIKRYSDLGKTIDDDKETPNQAASKSSTATTTATAEPTKNAKAKKRRKRSKRHQNDNNLNCEEEKTEELVAASTSSSTTTTTKTTPKRRSTQRKRHHQKRNDSSNDVSNQNGNDDDEVRMEEGEKVDSDDCDDDSDDTRPGAFRVAGMEGNHDLSSDDETNLYERNIDRGDDRYITSTAAETTSIPAIEAQQVDEEALEKEYQEKARQTVLQRLKEETTTHAVQVNSTDANTKERPKTSVWRLLLLLFILLVIVCAIVIPITRRSSKNQQHEKSGATILQDGDDDDDDDEEITDFEFLQQQILLQIFNESTKDNYQNYFGNASTAQYKALDWLLREDPAMVNVREIELSTLIDRYVLAVLYFSTSGHHWFYNSDSTYFNSLPVCDWAVIGCDTTNSIIAISIESNNLQGTIPMEISFLTSLEEILLSRNKLYGTIPSEFARLTRLEWLQLSANSLTGSIPESLQELVNLEQLYLAVNQLTGTIPPGLVQLPLLEAFQVGYNLLSGTIPEINQQQPMQALILQSNMFSGSIPDSVTKLTGLEELRLDDNQLTGTIPSEIGMITELEWLIISQNQLSGTIPSTLGELEYLQTLLLSRNYNLNGTIPTEFGKLTSLQSAYLYGNQLSGTLPSELGLLTNLVNFFIDWNPLSGTIPSTFSQLTALETLSLSYTNLTGDLDIYICKQRNNINHVQADCAGSTPKVLCSCCTSCCNEVSGCVFDTPQACTNYARDLENNVLQNQASCTCTDDNRVAFCDLTECPTCNEDLSVCGVTTEFRRILSESITPIGWISTMQYKTGRHANHTISWEYVIAPGTCSVYVNGVECNRCTTSICQDGFRGKDIDCSNILNVDGPLTYKSCFPTQDESSVLDMIQWTDTDSWTGCPFVPMEYIL